MIQSVTAPALYGLAIVLAFVGPPGAIAAQVAVGLFFVPAPAQTVVDSHPPG